MNKIAVAFAGAAVGAGVMFLFDPRRGRRRRARLGEAAAHVAHRTQAIAGLTERDVRHRLTGAAARALDRLVAKSAPSDEVLVERVRARLGRLVSHPGAIEVVASAGTVTLKGPVFDAEVDQLLRGVATVAGVTAVEHKLEPHGDAVHVSALQGRGPHTAQRPAANWLRWTPTSRLAAGVAGAALLALSLPKRPLRGAAAAAWGVELIACALLGDRTWPADWLHPVRGVAR
jgi:hypothetical protein